MNDMKQLNDLNQNKYEQELEKHGQRQDQMRMMLVKEKIA